MAGDPLERLDIVISLIDRFSMEIDQILFKLGQLHTAIEEVDGKTITIDVDLEDDEQALARLAALRGAPGGETRVGGGGMAFGRVQTAQLGRVIKQLGELDLEAGNVTKTLKHVSDAADEAEDAFKITNLRMSDLHNALAKAVPLIIVIIGAMPALIAGLVAVGAAAFAAATALAAITALGALGMALRDERGLLESMKDVFEEIKDSFLDAFAPLARRLTPEFEAFIDGLGILFEEIAANGDILLGLRDEAAAFGRFMLDFVPAVIANMGRMAEAFSGVFGLVADALEDMNIMRGLTQFMAQALPALVTFITLLISITKHLVEMSIGFLQMTNAVLAVINVFLEIITIGGRFNKVVGFIIAGVLTLVTTMFILKGIMALGLIPAMASLAQTIVAVTFEFIAFGSTASIIGGIINMLTLETLAWATAMALATAGLSLLIGMATMAASKWLTMGDNIRGATKELKKFNRVGQRLSGADNPFAEPALTGRVGRGAGGGDINVTIEGNADEKTVRETAWNTMMRGRTK